MSDLILHKQNEAFIKFDCDKSVAQELADYFTFFVPGYQFMPAYKSRVWDGRIRLADLRTYTIYHGLVPYIEKFCEERDYKLEIDAEVNNAEMFSAIEANEFIEQLQLDKDIITEGIREYQYKSFLFAIRNRRMLLLSPTGSGKSLIQYLILRYLQHKDHKKGLLIVPTISLCYQMFNDFKSYSSDNNTFNVDDEISIVMGGKDKNPKVDRIKITLEDDTIRTFKPNEVVKTKRGNILAKDLISSDEIL